MKKRFDNNKEHGCIYRTIIDKNNEQNNECEYIFGKNRTEDDNICPPGKRCMEWCDIYQKWQTINGPWNNGVKGYCVNKQKFEEGSPELPAIKKLD